MGKAAQPVRAAEYTTALFTPLKQKTELLLASVLQPATQLVRLDDWPPAGGAAARSSASAASRPRGGEQWGRCCAAAAPQREKKARRRENIDASREGRKGCRKAARRGAPALRAARFV